MNREAGRGEDQILPANVEVLQRLNEVLRQQAPAEESGNRDTHGPGVSGEESMGPGDEQEQPGDGEMIPVVTRIRTAHHRSLTVGMRRRLG
eukprot:jgi/Botrbrau1/12154/Bobra.0186s0065.1